tara:strand:+ start:3744 stop:4373 length:630 start_codon:yes stop_codon:yes gene_type:complete
MKGYWVVAVQDVLKPDAWGQVLSAFENYVEESDGICKPISFAPPAAVYESGISKTTAVIEFPSLDDAVHARTRDSSYFQGVIEADGTPVENKAIRDFRIIETEGGWMKPGHGYWLVWVREFIDKDNWIGKVMPAWQEYVASGACKVHHLKPPHMALEDGRMFPFALCEFPSLQAAIDARESDEYNKDVLGAAGKPVHEMVTRDFRIIEG